MLVTGIKAQNSMGAANDNERVAIAPIITEKSSDLPQNVQNLLVNKMRQTISLNGLSASDEAPLFIMFPEIAIVSEETTSTAPPMYVKQLDVNLVIADQYTGTVFNSINYQLKGAGKNPTQAYQNAFKHLNPRDGRMKAFVEKGKDAIIEYYNSHCDLVISRANSLADQKKYTEALDLLNSTPPVCRECFDKANAAAAEIGKNMPQTAAVYSSENPDGSTPEEGVYNSDDEIYLGDGLYIKFDFAEMIGEQTQVNLSILNKGEEDVDFGLSNIWHNTILITGKGYEYKLNRFFQAGKENRGSKVVIGTPCPLQLIFKKTTSIQFLTFSYGNNTFKFRNLPVTVH